MLVLLDEAIQLANTLTERQLRVVLAESCTAGLASAALAQVPGISDWHCGSAVTYREGTKEAWLGVSAADIKQHTAVSDPVARQMAAGVLRETPEADFAASITGHLGPKAPAGFDGLAFIGIAHRQGESIDVLSVARVQLQSTDRVERQNEAAAMLLHLLRDAIEKHES